MTVRLPPLEMGTLPPTPEYSSFDLTGFKKMPTVQRAKTDGIETKMTTCCFWLTWVNTFAYTYIRPSIWERKRL